MQQEQWRLLSSGPAQTTAFAAALAEAAQPGEVLAAYGDLGAGKTLFAAGLARGLEVCEPVLSPTYIYYQQYPGRLPFCHIDAYRLQEMSEEDIYQLGIGECFAGDQFVYCEWPQYLQGFLPPQHLQLWIEPLPEQAEARCLRWCFAAGRYPRWAQCLAALGAQRG